MSENPNHDTGAFSPYDTMETEALEELLRQDCQSPADSQLDTDELLSIMTVLSQRRQDLCAKETASQRAWEEFQKDYMPGQKSGNPPRPAAKRSVRFPYCQIAAMVAVVVLALCIPLITGTSKSDATPPQLPSDASTVFYFTADGTPHYGQSAQSSAPATGSVTMPEARVEDAVNLLPTWVPEGYLPEAAVVEKLNDTGFVYTQVYKKGEQVLIVTIREFDPDRTATYYINDVPPVIVESAGATFYIFPNENTMQVFWFRAPFECSISCDLEMDEIQKLLNSIGKE